MFEPQKIPLFRVKQAYGLGTTVVTIESILAKYPGGDDAEKLRNFIKDAYSTWGTDFVLLAGDTNDLTVIATLAAVALDRATR